MTRSCALLGVAFVVIVSFAVAQRPADYVDPFIGTAGGGNTFPGAVRPWGMVSVSPHNAPGSPSGYIYGRTRCTGFGHVHLSGTGCADLGSVVLSFSRDSGAVVAPPSAFRLDSEVARPGYYRARLEDLGIIYEASATQRCGISRVVVERPGPLRVYIDAGTGLAVTGGGICEVESSTQARGENISGGFCGESNRQTIHFVARLSRPAMRSGTWIGNRATRERSIQGADCALGAWFEFDLQAHDTLLVKIGLSYAGLPDRNLDAEIPDLNFDAVEVSAFNEWDSLLSRIRVTGGSRNDAVKFYTAIYHMLIHPSIVSDVNGEYLAMNRRMIMNRGYDRYSIYSLWDTYRTLHPFLTLVFPERQSAMIRSMLDMYQESGRLPKWELAGNETHMMVGDGAVCVIADSYMKGIRDFDVSEAIAAIRKHTLSPTDDAGRAARPGYDEYLKYGYIPFDQDTTQAWWVWGPVSTTLEYCAADYAASQMLGAAGENRLAQQLRRRSAFYRNLFDTVSGFMRPKLRNGRWLDPFDPLATEGSGNWSGSGGPGFVEGNAWQYTWFVPHDIPGLIRLFGGNAGFTTKLNSCFRQRMFTINNEPDMAYPYLFNEVPGWEGRTREIVEEISRDRFHVGPDGLPGNDDAGTTSGWYVFSSMGIYPDCPGSASYQLGLPAFDTVTVSLNRKYWKGTKLVIGKETGIRGVEKDLQWQFDGQVLPRPMIDHLLLTEGGTLVLVRRR